MADGTTPAVPAEPSKPDAKEPQSLGGGNLAAGGVADAPEKVEPVVEVDEYEELLKKKPLTLKTREGKEVKIGSRKELEHHTLRGLGGGKVYEENKSLKAQLAENEAFLKRLDDPKQAREIFRKAYGPEWRKMAESESLEAFEEEERLKGIPADVRARLEEAKSLKAERDELAAERADNQRRQADGEQQAKMQKLRKEILDVGGPALVKAGFGPKPPASVINRLGSYMAEALEMEEEGLGSTSPEIVAEAIKRDMQEEHRALTESLVKAGDGAGLVAWLGEGVINVLRKYDLGRLRGAGASPSRPAAPVVAAPESRGDAKKFWGAL